MHLNPIALRAAITPLSFGHSRVKDADGLVNSVDPDQTAPDLYCIQIQIHCNVSVLYTDTNCIQFWSF